MRLQRILYQMLHSEVEQIELVKVTDVSSCSQHRGQLVRHVEAKVNGDDSRGFHEEVNKVDEEDSERGNEVPRI